MTNRAPHRLLTVAASLTLAASLTGCADQTKTTDAPDPGVGGIGANGKNQAASTVAAADVQNVAAAINATMTSGEGYPVSLDAATLASLNVRLTPGSQVGSYRHNPDGFTVCVQNSGTWAYYDSTQGGISQSGTTGVCP